MAQKLIATLVMEERRLNDVYPPAVIGKLDVLTELQRPFLTREAVVSDRSLLSKTQILFTGWGAPELNATLLAAAPDLQCVLMAAGSVKSITPPEFWAAKIPIVSAAAANAIPVAEFSLANILLALKQTHRLSRDIRRSGGFPPSEPAVDGAVGTTVGLVSLGEIGRGVAAALRSTAVRVIAYDPMMDPERAAAIGVELVGLEELFERSQVVSIHAPLLAETAGLVDGALLRRMPEGATLINTARGAVVNERELIRVMTERADLTAVLDVTWPEPPDPGSPLYTLENVVLTPHIAGAMGAERARMGELVAAEAARWIEGRPLHHAMDPARVATAA